MHTCWWFVLKNFLAAQSKQQAGCDEDMPPYPSTPERGQVGPPGQDGAAGGLPANNRILVSRDRETNCDLQQRLLSRQPALRAEHTRAEAAAMLGGVAHHHADAGKIHWQTTAPTQDGSLSTFTMLVRRAERHRGTAQTILKTHPPHCC